MIADTVSARPARHAVLFHGSEADYWRLMIRGAVLLVLTLGLYRFWLATETRRFLWSNTTIAGDNLEYTGTPLELLIGFLIAVTALVPLYAVILLAALGLGLIGQLLGLLALALLIVLTQVAVYRARRYRLTRTLYRGLRFRQTGSAWRYAICALFWWILTLASLGLAYPWARARLERWKMDNTFFGDLAGGFEGTGLDLLLRGGVFWLVTIAPLIAGLIAAATAIDWAGVTGAILAGGDDVLGRIEGASPGFAGAVVILALAFCWTVLSAATLYPAFQAVTLRWWLSGLRFGRAGARSDLRIRTVYAAYTRFLGYGLAFAGVAGSVLVPLVLLARFLGEHLFGTPAGEAVVTVLAIAGYAVVALGFSTLYQVTVRLALWRLGAHSISLTNPQVLDRVKAVEHPGSSLGEGLAAALRVDGW